MRPIRFCARIILGIGSLVVAGATVTSALAGSEKTLAALAAETHFHGIAVSPTNPPHLYLATHHGFYVVSLDGKARRVSESSDDFMGFTPHPTEASTLYASGHPAGGGNLGVMMSTDSGRTWRKLSDGVNGPVDFHQMDVSKSNPKVLYGVHGSLQKSLDGGRSWASIAPAPDGLIDLAVGARADTLYAATRQGLLGSTDGGRSWKQVHPSRQAVTMVHATGDGRIYAFLVGTGLIRASERDLAWDVVGSELNGRYLLHLAVAPGESGAIYGIAFNPADRSQTVLASADGGRTWTAIGGR